MQLKTPEWVKIPISNAPLDYTLYTVYNAIDQSTASE